MTTADLIAVMNAGRIEQLGTPQQVYEQPRSEFTARFLGGSNILRGKALDATRFAVCRHGGRLQRRAAGAGADVACRSASTISAFPATRRHRLVRQRRAGHGGAQRLSRRHPRLHRRGQGTARSCASRRRRRRISRRVRKCGFALPAAACRALEG
jgi:ABC-type Fe3+/spermidine/putrescine transport system ATPase subunit